MENSRVQIWKKVSARIRIKLKGRIRIKVMRIQQKCVKDMRVGKTGIERRTPNGERPNRLKKKDELSQKAYEEDVAKGGGGTVRTWCFRLA